MQFDWSQRLHNSRHSSSRVVIAIFFACCCLNSFWSQGNEDLGGDTHILFVFDASNSMNAFWDGQRKIEVATRLLSESLSELYGIPGLQLGLRVYGHQTKFIQGQQDCDDTELVVPFSHGNNLIIKKALGRIQAKGTTPIARSLEKAAIDFPNGPGRKVVVLITDGIEACDEDPCVVSRMLQDQGIIVKPFIIGIGLEEQYKETFECVGNFFDATDAETFKEVLDIVIEQAMHDTSFEVNLFDSKGESSVTNVAVSLIDYHSGEVINQYIHTLGMDGLPDTLHVDPILTYRVVVHTLPPLVRDSVRFAPRKHNHVSFEKAGQGTLSPSFARGTRNDFGDLPITIYQTGQAEPLFTMEVNASVNCLAGVYDVYFPTFPPVMVQGVELKEGVDSPVIIPQPGYLQLNAQTAGFGVILDSSNSAVYRWDLAQSNPSGQYLLQPGDYTLIFRARSAKSSEYSSQKKFNIRSGFTTHLSVNG